MSELKLYVGTGIEGLRPEGYRTIDINPDNKPDIVADARALEMIGDGEADEFYASHVLEHFSWPESILVLKEWTRVLRHGGVLKVAVPDMDVYAAMLIAGSNPHVVMGDIFGGHWAGDGQGHRYGYTKRTLLDALTVLGYGNFDHWSSDLPEAANGWIRSENGEKIAISLNVKAIKLHEPLVAIDALYAELRAHVQKPFQEVVRSLAGDTVENLPADISTLMYQRLHFRYLELKAHAERLEGLLKLK